MKISCPSCAAKYTIADDKVRGKTVRIKCKKCGATITAGEEGAPEAAGAGAGAAVGGGEPEWMVNVGEGDQRSLGAAQIADLYRQGVINDETFLWREGMSDWLSLRNVPEVASALPPKAASAPPPPNEMDDALPTMMAPAVMMPMGNAPRPAAGAPAAARRADAPRPAGRDLFSPAARHDDEDEDPATRVASTAELGVGGNFSLAPLGASPAPTAARRAPEQPAIDANEASGILDIRKLQGALMGKAPEDDKKKKQDDKLDDIMNLGGGAPMFGGSLAAPDLLAPPDLSAPPPPPVPPPVAAIPTASAAPLPQAAPPQKSSKGLLIGIGAAALLALGVGGGVLMAGGKKEDKADKAEVAATADTSKTAKADEGTKGDKADKGSTDAPKPDEPKKDDKPAEAKKDEPIEADPAAATPGKPITPEEKKRREEALKKKKEEEDKKKKDEEDRKKKEEEDKKKKEAEAAAANAPGGDKPVDRAAANSALGAKAAQAASCKKGDGPTGTGRVSVTFAPSGKATTANIEGPPFAGTSVGSCVAGIFRTASIPPFSGSATTFKKSFTIN